jgi:hypothetical protein
MCADGGRGRAEQKICINKARDVTQVCMCVRLSERTFEGCELKTFLLLFFSSSSFARLNGLNFMMLAVVV